MKEIDQKTRHDWFINRIGKRIYGTRFCSCPRCIKTHKEGMLVEDERDATHLWEMESISLNEGGKIMFFDTKKQADDFELRRKDK